MGIASPGIQTELDHTPLLHNGLALGSAHVSNPAAASVESQSD